MGFWESLFFWVFAFSAIVASMSVILFRNPLYSALALIVDFLCFAGLYGLLSAHFIAVTQVLVYTGAIMVLFLFIIMLLNLGEDELERFEFRIHYALAIAAASGMFILVVSLLMPLVDMGQVREQQAVAVKAHEETSAKKAELLKKAESEADEAKKAQWVQQASALPEGPIVQTKSAVPGLYAQLNEAGLEREYARRVEAYRAGVSSPAQGKYPRFEEGSPMVIPPGMTGEALKTKHGEVKRGRPATFGTIQPISVLMVNRFVVPFELTALLLLAAIIGAVIIAKRRL